MERREEPPAAAEGLWQLLGLDLAAQLQSQECQECLWLQRLLSRPEHDQAAGAAWASGVLHPVMLKMEDRIVFLEGNKFALSHKTSRTQR